MWKEMNETMIKEISIFSLKTLKFLERAEGRQLRNKRIGQVGYIKHRGRG